METVGTSSAIGSTPWWSAGAGIYGSQGRFADDSSNAVRINSAGRANAAGIENLLDQNQFSATNKNIVDGHSRICDNLNFGAVRQSDQFTALTKNTTDAEFRAIARENAIRSEMVANNLASVERDHRAEIEAIKCCCKAEATALAVETRGIQRDLDTANRQLSEQTIINTIAARCGCCTPAA